MGYKVGYLNRMKIAVDKIKNWIFVTGAPRSGTTFVGQILSTPIAVDYIHEPFNPGCGIPGIGARYSYVRPSLDSAEMQRYHAMTRRIFSYDFTLKTNVDPTDSRGRKLIKALVGSRGPFHLRLAKPNPFHRAAIIKDPTGLFLTEYLYKTFDVKPVILVKHPISLVASFRRVGWQPLMAYFKNQPYLIEDYFADRPTLFNDDHGSLVQQVATFWTIAYKVLLEQANSYPDWQVILHEELCEQPVSTLQQLYKAVGLSWSTSIERKVKKLTQGNSSAEAKAGKVQDFKRDSSNIFKMRRDSLTLSERHEIFEIVKDVALPIYSRASFALD